MLGLGYRPLWMDLPVQMWPDYFAAEKRLAQQKRHSRGSAGAAMGRLREVVSSDRAECPTYRWVRVGLREIRGSWWAASVRIYEPGKPRYRLERRR